MAAAITFPATVYPRGHRQNRTFTSSFPAPTTLSFSGDALDSASTKMLCSSISYSSHSAHVILHAKNPHFLRSTLVNALPQSTKTTFKPDTLEDFCEPPAKEDVDIKDLLHGSTSRVESLFETVTETAPNRSRTAIKEKNPKLASLDHSEVLKYPIVTESGMRNIIKNNTLVFAVDKRADKTVIKAVAEKMFKIQIKKVNTSISPDGTKKAFLMLKPDHSAADVANMFKL